MESTRSMLSRQFCKEILGLKLWSRGCTVEKNQIVDKMNDSLVYLSSILCYRSYYLRHFLVIVVIIIDLISVSVKFTRKWKCKVERGQNNHSYKIKRNPEEKNLPSRTVFEVKLLGRQYSSVSYVRSIFMSNKLMVTKSCLSSLIER